VGKGAEHDQSATEVVDAHESKKLDPACPGRLRSVGCGGKRACRRRCRRTCRGVGGRSGEPGLRCGQADQEDRRPAVVPACRRCGAAGQGLHSHRSESPRGRDLRHRQRSASDQDLHLRLRSQGSRPNAQAPAAGLSSRRRARRLRHLLHARHSRADAAGLRGHRSRVPRFDRLWQGILRGHRLRWSRGPGRRCRAGLGHGGAGVSRRSSRRYPRLEPRRVDLADGRVRLPREVPGRLRRRARLGYRGPHGLPDRGLPRPLLRRLSHRQDGQRGRRGVSPPLTGVASAQAADAVADSHDDQRPRRQRHRGRALDQESRGRGEGLRVQDLRRRAGRAQLQPPGQPANHGKRSTPSWPSTSSPDRRIATKSRCRCRRRDSVES